MLGLRLLQAARPADHRALAQAHREVLRHAETGTLPQALRPDQRQGRRRLAPACSRPSATSTRHPPLNLSAYAPLRYVLPHKQAEYDAKYSTQVRGGESFFRQVDREESLIHLMRVNLLKRMESSVHVRPDGRAPARRRRTACSPSSTSHADGIEELSIEDVDLDDPAFEPACRPQGQGAAAGRGPHPLAAGPHRGPQPPGHAAGECPRCQSRPRRQARRAARTLIKDKIATPAQRDRWQPQAHRLHRLR
jgi:hypothetical protein